MGSDVLCKLENVFLEGFYVRHGVCVCVLRDVLLMSHEAMECVRV